MSILMTEYDYATDIAVKQEEAYTQGAYPKALETARKLIGRGYSPEDIADLSGLTLSQVQELLPA